MGNNIIYLRTSSPDDRQNPKLQLKSCKELANKLQLKDYEIFEEKGSAYKDDSNRKIFANIEKQIQKRAIKHLVVFDLDRIYRNRKKVVEFIRSYSKLGLKVHSYNQQWLEELNDIPHPWNEMLSDFMLNIVGWMGEEESTKKSVRVKMAVVKKKGKPTLSYKGNKWGRKPLSTFKKNKIKQLREQNPNMSLREIAEKVEVSKSAVHKYIAEINT